MRSALHHHAVNVLVRFAETTLGSSKAAALAVGKHERHLGDLINGRVSLSLDLVEEYLDAIGVSKQEFFDALSDEMSRGTTRGNDTVPIPDEKPQGELAVLLDLAAQLSPPFRQELAEDALTVHSRSDYIDTLDRDDACHAAGVWLLELALCLKREAITPERIIEVATALGTWGMIMRRSDRHEQALHAFREAFRLHDRTRRSASFVRLLQRYAYVLNDFGRYDEGIELLGEAIQTADLLDLSVERSKLLVDHGILFYGAENHTEGQRAFHSALNCLSGSEELYRLTALRGVLRCQVRLQRPNKAKETLKRIEAQFPSLQGSALAHVLWDRAELAQSDSDYEKAIAYYRQACGQATNHWSLGQQAVLLLHFGLLLNHAGKIGEFEKRLVPMIQILSTYPRSLPIHALLVSLQTKLKDCHRQRTIRQTLDFLKEALRRTLQLLPVDQTSH